MPDYGTARCDFPAGDAHRLFKTITERLYTLPPSMLLYTGHDYQPNGRELQFAATIQLHRDSNVHLNAKTNLEDFVRFRTARDKTLSAPKLLYPSVQLNLTAGRLPEPRANGHRYLNIPIQTST